MLCHLAPGPMSVTWLMKDCNQSYNLMFRAYALLRLTYGFILSFALLKCCVTHHHIQYALNACSWISSHDSNNGFKALYAFKNGLVRSLVQPFCKPLFLMTKFQSWFFSPQVVAKTLRVSRTSPFNSKLSNVWGNNLSVKHTFWKR